MRIGFFLRSCLKSMVIEIPYNDRSVLPLIPREKTCALRQSKAYHAINAIVLELVGKPFNSDCNLSILFHNLPVDYSLSQIIFQTGLNAFNQQP